MISISHLKKNFGDLQLFKDINMEISTGDFYGIVGRSGAGKSTLLRCINGLETYSDGSIKVDGVEVNALSPQDAREFRKNIGMIFQQFSLLNRLDVYDNIALPMKCWHYQKPEIKKKVSDLLTLVGLEDKIHSLPVELSGGQKQRVAIARALTMDPHILLCDEATSALDPQTSNAIIALLEEIRIELGITIVVVTHQMSVLRRACEKIAILENGRVAESGDVKEIFFRKPQTLLNIIGEEDWQLPETGKNIRIALPEANEQKPFITQMTRELEIDFLFLGGETERFRDQIIRFITINVKDSDYGIVTAFLSSHGIHWTLFEERAGGA